MAKLAPHEFSIYSPDFLCANLAIIQQGANYEDTGPQAMMRMTCLKAVALLGRIALHAFVNLLATAAEVGAEFGLSERMAKMLAAQIGFRRLLPTDRDHAACTLVASILYMLRVYDNAAELQADVCSA